MTRSNVGHDGFQCIAREWDPSQVDHLVLLCVPQKAYKASRTFARMLLPGQLPLGPLGLHALLR